MQAAGLPRWVGLLGLFGEPHEHLSRGDDPARGHGLDGLHGLADDGLLLPEPLAERLSLGGDPLDRQEPVRPQRTQHAPPAAEGLGDGDARRGRDVFETGLRQLLAQPFQLDGGLAGVGVLDTAAEQLGVSFAASNDM